MTLEAGTTTPAEGDASEDPAMIGIEIRLHFRSCGVCHAEGRLVEKVCPAGAALFRRQLAARFPVRPRLQVLPLV